MKVKLLYFILLLAIFSACKRAVIPASEVTLGKEYFPLSLGHFIEYQVDSIVYDDFHKTTDTIHFQYRDEVADTFADNEGRKSFIVNRYQRPDSNSTWAENITYYITQANASVEVVENNLRYIKMVFPVKANTNWDGNIYIPSVSNPELNWLNGWDYHYAEINSDFDNGIQTFPNSLCVAEANIYAGDSLGTIYSQRTFAQEVYAKNIGLIYKELVNWEYQENTHYRKGFVLVYRAIYHN